MSTPRLRADRCPGLLRPHQAQDGLLIRLRIPGGRLRAEQLVALRDVAERFGSGLLQLTSRGNVQLRGLADDCRGELIEEITSLGLLPSDTHERVRNITASPLTGLAGGHADLRILVDDLDRLLCAMPELAALPGRFLFTLDDGRGDVTALSYDLAFQALDDERGMILIGGHQLGRHVELANAAETMCGLAREFLQLRSRTDSSAWHLREIDPELLGSLDARLEPMQPLTGQPAVPLGEIGGRDNEGAASVGVPLGLLDSAQVDAIASTGADLVIITPWRGVVLPGVGASVAELARAGFITNEEESWSKITACIGAPFCGKAMIDTRGLARSLAAEPNLPAAVHISGCDRRCGAPGYQHLDLVAPADLATARVMMAGRPATGEVG